MIEFDPQYFTFPFTEIEQEKKICRLGAFGIFNVAIMEESTVLEDTETRKKSNHCNYFKAKVLMGQKTDEVLHLLELTPLAVRYKTRIPPGCQNLNTIA